MHLARHRCAPIGAAALVSVLLGWTPAAASMSDAFQPVGHLVEARDGAQATPLTDGTVLVTGGNKFVDNDFSALTSAELFDPKTNKFSAVSPMTGPRDDSHRAVQLKDGRVLITGGSPDYQTHLRSAELFNPSTRTFTSVAEMTEARSAHTATLLPDGRVLIAGGYGSNPEGPKASAELFDPATGRFEQTASMAVPRYRHAAVALPDGRVVILGGYAPGNEAYRSVEIYDPKTGTFTARGELVEGRGDMTATLLPDGRILVVGGLYPGKGSTNSVEIYDPATGQSATVDALSDARRLHGAAHLPGGRVLVAGGEQKVPGMDAVPLRTVEVVDPSTGKVSPTVPLMTQRDRPAVVALPDGRVLILGGWNDDDGSLATAEVYVTGTP